MGKLIGSIIILLILTQPTCSGYMNATRNVSVHIFQEYKDVTTLDILKKELQKEDKEITVLGLKDGMSLLGNLLRTKNEIVQNVQKIMNNKIGRKEKMTEEQITQFQKFSSITKDNTEVLSAVLNQIQEKKELKNIQDAVMQEEIDYNQIARELQSVQGFENRAVEMLSDIINEGNRFIELMA